MAYLIDFEDRSAKLIAKHNLDNLFFKACDDLDQKIIANGNRISGIEAI